MRVDIHVHTNKYSDCGISSPDEMVQAAIDSGLDALVFAEHNYMWTPAELNTLQRRYPEIKLFSGIEVSIDGEEHIVVIGVPDPKRFYPFMKPAQVIAAVKDHGGAAILAHPFRWSSTVRQDILETDFDAIEIHSNSIRNYMLTAIKNLQSLRNLPLVASSDGHHTGGLGLYAIDLYQPVENDKDLARQIRHGEFSLWCNPKRIDALNLEITATMRKLPELLGRGTGTKDVLQQVGLNRNLSWAVDKKLDILYPKGVEI